MLFYSVLKADICGSQDFIAEKHPQNFSTPQYPLPFLPNSNCEWNITTNFFNETILLVLYDFVIDKNVVCKIVEVSNQKYNFYSINILLKNSKQLNVCYK